MNLIELQRALRQLRLGGIAAVLETRLRQAQAEPMAPIDLVACLVSDELTRRSERLLDRRRKHVADAALGPDEARRAGVGLELAPQAQNLHVDRSIVDVVVEAARLQ